MARRLTVVMRKTPAVVINGYRTCIKEAWPAATRRVFKIQKMAISHHPAAKIDPVIVQTIVDASGKAAMWLIVQSWNGELVELAGPSRR